MKLTVVGCSGSYPGPESPASCYLVQAEHEGRTHNLVLDLGSGALGHLQRYIDLDEIDAIILSHLHPDHCLDLTGLFVVQKYHPQPRKEFRRIPVYGPQDTAARMSRANGVTLSESSDPAGMTPEFDFQTLVTGIEFVVGPFTITPRRVNHPVEAFGVRIEGDGAVLTYTGDTDSCAALEPLMHDADVVLADAAFIEGRDDYEGVHLSGRRAAQAAVDAGGVGHLVLTHIPAWNDPQIGITEAKQVWDGPLTLAQPGLVLEV